MFLINIEDGINAIHRLLILAFIRSTNVYFVLVNLQADCRLLAGERALNTDVSAHQSC